MSRIAAAAVLSLTLSLAACHCPPKAGEARAEPRPMAMHDGDHHMMVEVKHAEPARGMKMMKEEPGCIAGCPCYEDEDDRDMARLRDRRKKSACSECGHEGCTGCGTH